jgi:hypothetical protein
MAVSALCEASAARNFGVRQLQLTGSLAEAFG